MPGNLSSAYRPPARPSLKFYGNGFTRAAWTVAHFPEHNGYCEPCFGAGSIFMRKSPAKLEIANDIDGRVVNYFAVVRERPDELIRAIHLTPWHEVEYQRCLQKSQDPLEDARRFFFACWASVKGGPVPGSGDFRLQKKQTRRSAAVRDIANLDHLYVISQRLKNVQFYSRDALIVIRKVRGSKMLVYFDPPYLSSTRTRKRNGYSVEPGEQWHRSAAELLRAHDGPVIVAGYASEVYAQEYEAYGWKRVEREQATNSGGRRVECLWLSPMAQAD